MAKKQKREFKGDTKPDLIEKAIAAFQPMYGEPWEESPTSVELFDSYARVWFEYFGEDAAEDELQFDWSFSLVVPLYYFWGKKKRDKYLKEQKQLCDERSRKLDELLEKLRKKKWRPKMKDIGKGIAVAGIWLGVGVAAWAGAEMMGIIALAAFGATVMGLLVWD